MSSNKGIVDVDTTLSNRKPELQVQIDRPKAAHFGLRVTDIANALHTLVGGDIVGTYKEADDQYDVWLRAEAHDRGTQEALGEVMVRAGTGSRFPLSTNANASEASLVQLANFVKLEEARGPNQIDRFQRQRKVTLVGNLARDSHSLGNRQAALALEPLAQRFSLYVGHGVEQQTIRFAGIEQWQDVRMGQPRRNADLLQEPFVPQRCRELGS